MFFGKHIEFGGPVPVVVESFKCVYICKLMSLFYVFSRIHCDRSVGVPLSK